jgi:hypothetical protein
VELGSADSFNFDNEKEDREFLPSCIKNSECTNKMLSRPPNDNIDTYLHKRKKSKNGEKIPSLRSDSSLTKLQPIKNNEKKNKYVVEKARHKRTITPNH